MPYCLLPLPIHVQCQYLLLHKFYEDHFKNNIKKNGIQIIYTIGPPKIEDFQIYMDDICFIKRKINKITSIHELKKC